MNKSTSTRRILQFAYEYITEYVIEDNLKDVLKSLLYIKPMNLN